jgi:transposase
MLREFRYEATAAFMHCSKERLIELLIAQGQEIQVLKEHIRLLTQEVDELRSKLSQHSQNSHKPPSSDGYAKPNPQSRRSKSTRKPGGQQGHAGSRLEPVDASEVDSIQTCKAACCRSCGQPLLGEGFLYEARQEIELPVLKRQVTEYRTETHYCERCGVWTQGQFPAHITQPVQYGKRLKALSTYFNQYQLMPYARVQECLRDVFGVSLSQGSLVRMNTAFCQQLVPIDTAIQTQIAQSGYGHFDETGLRIRGSLQWLHVASTRHFTHYAVDPKRGHGGIQALGVLPQFKGCATHDHFKPYFAYPCAHSLCNAHHLRELRYIQETYGQKWCKRMQTCLLRMKKAVDKRKASGFSCLTPAALHILEQAYRHILQEGFKEVMKLSPLLPSSRAHTSKQHPAKNLLDRLTFHQAETLRFLYDFQVLFDNNQAERDLRMMKVKQKISGCFRSTHGGKAFCRIRGYLSTVKKHGLPVLDALINVVPDVTSLRAASLSQPP